MGFMDLFSKGPLSEAKISKIAKLAANPYAQPDVRMREMQRLLVEGTPAALRGVLKRFAATAQGHIADEDEKKWLEDELVETGEDALGPLGDYIGSEENLTYALRAYRRIAGPERAVGFFLDVLKRYGPEDYRSGEAKLQLIWQLADDLADPRVLPALCSFLLDHSDDVRWAAMDIMVRGAEQKLLGAEVRAEAAMHLGHMVTADDTGPRIQRRAAELLADLEWEAPGEVDNLVPLLDEEFFLDKKRFVRRRAKKRLEPK
jgi:hypothetical protein